MTNDKYLFLPGKVNSFTKQIITDHDFLKQVHSLSSGTVSMVFPQVVAQNFIEFKEVFKKKNLSHAIYFAHKPNKSFALVRELARISDACIDVASLGELDSALSAGFDAKRICAGGPKNNDFLQKCVKEKVTLSIDSIGELKHLILKIKNANLSSHPIFVRLNVESLLITDKESRFGLLKEELPAVLSLIKENKTFLQFKGFSFHINDDAKKKRKQMIEIALQLTLQAIKEGLSPTHINIGGGFRINYISQAESWYAYTSALQSSLIKQDNFLGWNKSGLGYWNEEGKIRGKQQFPELYQSETQYEELENFLDIRLEEYGKSVSEVLQDFMLTLVIEPGRSMLDCAGITITRVIDKKKTSVGNDVLIVDMNRSQLGGSDQTYMVDPIIISNSSLEKNNIPFSTFIAGNLCMKSDIIFRHKTFLPYEPEVGDLLIFVNTAAYYMDFSESNTLQQPIAPKFAVWKERENFCFISDEQYLS